MRRTYVGVDLHTDKFNACYLGKDVELGNKTFPLTENGLDAFRSTLNKSDHVAVEATTNAPYFFDQIEKHVSRVVLVAPSKFAIIGKSVKKTDRNDARMLAVFLSKGMLPEARKKSDLALDLASLISTRVLLVKARAALFHKTQSILVRHGVKVQKGRLVQKSGYEKYVFNRAWPSTTSFELNFIYAQVRLLSSDLMRLEKKIDDLAKTFHGYEGLVSIKGIGASSAAVFLSIIDNVKDFKRPEQLVSYFGIAPRVRESNGTNAIRSITRQGSRIGRSTLVQCTLTAIRLSPFLKSFYERTKARRGFGKAMIATARKLLVIIFNTLKNDWVFTNFPTFEYIVKPTAVFADVRAVNHKVKRK